MKIAYLYPSINPNKGGIERVTYVVSRYLMSKGFICFFIGLQQKRDEREPEMVYLPDKGQENTPRNIEFFLKFLREKQIDIVINQGAMFKSNSCELAYKAKLANVKVVNCIHNSLLDPLRHLETAYSNKIKKYKLE